jgi:hypothetical protein
MKIFSPKVFMCLLLISLLPSLIASSCKDNVTDPDTSNPGDFGFSRIGTYKTTGTANSVFVRNINGSDVAFVADGNSGVQIINVTNPALPQLISTYNTNGYSYDITSANVNGTEYAFIADGTNDFILLDVSALSNPIQKYHFDFVDDAVVSVAIDTQNKKAFAGSYKGFLYIVDLTGLPDSLSVIGTYQAYDRISGIFVYGSRCYLAENNFGLEIINLTDYTFPVSISYTGTPGQSYDVYVNNGIAYVADGTAGISLFNVVNETNPVYLKSVKTNNESTSLFYGQQRMFSAEKNYGIEGFNNSEPTSPSVIGAIKTAGVPFGGQYYNSSVFIANGNEGLVVLGMTVK